MKTKHLILVIAFCLAVAIAAILLSQYQLPVTPINTDESDTVPPATTDPVPPTTIVVSYESGNTNSVDNEAYFKKFINPKTGPCAIVGLDKQTITLKDKNGRVIWTVGVTNAERRMPSGGVYELSFEGDHLFGRDSMGWGNGAYMTFYINVDTGKIWTGGVQHNP